MPSKKKNAIPDRWTDYTAVGKRIPGTRFITFKVPLKQSFRYQLTQSQVFGPFDLVHMLEKEGQELGLIIDLTFTTRYYKPQDLPDTLHHLKIFTAGHEVPNNATILSFKKAVRRFLRENENNDKLIGVHCTHGLNRTGYLICRYLIDVDGMEPRKAIELFNASRGHSIERQNYIDDLRRGPKRSNVGIEEPDQDPTQGCANRTQHDVLPHQREQHYHDPTFNGWRPHPGHRKAQNKYVPFHQKNNTKRFGPPDQVPYHSPMGMRPPHPSQSQLRPPRPSQSFGSTAPCPSQLHADMFGKPCRLPTPEGSKEPQGPHRKHRKNRKKGWKNKTSYGNRGDSQ
ncbi:RNA/RNP complex-1-interacting phosphatase isoform X2 [Myxocyprinus asiaticus]|uniref:RNA/RNP complex-1-interacting phosphatase isoform X2 n=1 Tax=Myxocyprinus asiaticus TaxID=70543 RepID=UPI00222372AC|nr:RNA/RNP complex-1-interacting phosphatase isoform X2 [Myxocyprinus asiaticus]XP_051540520.1 RNA/RNP complex-1-interacting phosphatase isoform X2 [Myxocyprinus asiaticus]